MNPKDSSIRYFVPFDLLASRIKVARIIRASFLARVRVPYSSGHRTLGQLPSLDFREVMVDGNYHSLFYIYLLHPPITTHTFDLDCLKFEVATF